MTRPPQLARREVHSWCVALDAAPETCARLYATLTADERNRSDRLRFHHDRRRFIVARGALREILGCYLGTRAGRVRFAYNASGKPTLSPEFSSRLRFNVSHSADLALVAIAADADIGVDLEYIRPSPEYADIARHFFSSAEVDQLHAAPSDRHAEVFLQCWTRKEAYVKARGESLAAASQRDDAWSLYTLRPAPGYVGALAIARSGWRLRQWQWLS